MPTSWRRRCSRSSIRLVRSGQALFDPELGIDFAHLVHGEQAFRWHALVVAGDELTTTLTVADISEKRGIPFYAFATESVDQRGEVVCVGIWTNIVRPSQ